MMIVHLPKLLALIIVSMASSFSSYAAAPPSAFPYGSAPKGNFCATKENYYATPESMLGSWAMIEAVAMDTKSGDISPLFKPTNVVYAVGTAAIGNKLGIADCAGGCNKLNGSCFAMKFNEKKTYPYMIFQSVNTGATNDSFDIYMAGGGAGAFPQYCAPFWKSSNIDWSSHIQNKYPSSKTPSPCDKYLGPYTTTNGYTNIKSSYQVIYNKVAHKASKTLHDACVFASTPEVGGVAGFNSQNWKNISVVPVSCPASLTQITGIKLAKQTKVGKFSVVDISKIQAADFTSATKSFQVKNNTAATQMQDCKTPSSGYCNNVTGAVNNYKASISASLTKPLLTAPLDNSYCQHNKTVTAYCSWDRGASTGGVYCNTDKTTCLTKCGDASHTWCTCNAQHNLAGCTDK